MKKGILLSILLALVLVISACGESAEEKQQKHHKVNLFKQ